MPRVTPELVAQARRDDVMATEVRLQAGRDLYVNRCGSCHGLAASGAYGDAEWRSWIKRMAHKAHIDSDQESMIFSYLRTARTVPDHP